MVCSVCSILICDRHYQRFQSGPQQWALVHTSVSIELLQSWHPTGFQQKRRESFSWPECRLILQIIISNIQHSRLEQNNWKTICTNKHDAIMNALPPSRQAINTQWLVVQTCRIKSPLRFLTHCRWLTCKQQSLVERRVSLASPLPPPASTCSSSSLWASWLHKGAVFVSPRWIDWLNGAQWDVSVHLLYVLKIHVLCGVQP